MESFIILGILIIALFLFSWLKIERAAEKADEGYIDDHLNPNSPKKE